MSRIETTYDLSRDLTIFKAVGTMEAAHFNDCLRRYYEAGVTTNALWDLSEAELSEITTDEIRSIALYGSQLAATRTRGKTALVFNSLFEYGLGRIFQTFVEMDTTPVQVELFLSLDEGMEWLGVEPSANTQQNQTDKHGHLRNDIRPIKGFHRCKSSRQDDGGGFP